MCMPIHFLNNNWNNFSCICASFYYSWIINNVCSSPHKILHPFACIIWIMAKMYVKVNNGRQQEKFNSYEHEWVYLHQENTEWYKPRILKTGLAKKSTHSATCQLKTMKNHSTPIIHQLGLGGSKLEVPSGISLSPTLKWRKF